MHVTTTTTTIERADKIAYHTAHIIYTFYPPLPPKDTLAADVHRLAK